ncbi:hypothetical protein FRC04_008381 [Tulasnella sp. 424]|nr:hypothetical protein FRC04_008381 [Tulasnella sp. 424]KAG8976753.1 hypothetical protein FRC05_003103 [Tulasnella sp. 425]
MDSAEKDQTPHVEITPSPTVSEVVNKPAEKTKAQAIILVLGTTLGQLSTVAGSAIQIQLPTIGRDLNIPESKLQWPITAYSITAGCMLLLCGRLADIYGRRKVFLLGAAWYIIWSLASGFAQNEIQLAIFRAFQGIGGAAIIPSAVGILAQEFPPGRARSIAFATFACGAPVGGSIGMLVGGTVTQLSSIHWRAMFFILCGMAALAGLAVFLVVPRDVRSSTRDKRVDWIGAALITVSLVLLLFVLAQGEVASNQWKTGYIIALLIVSILGIAAFIAWEHYLETKTTFPPLMRLTLWTRANGKFAAMQVIAFLEWVAFVAWGYWATLFYQNYLGLSPVKAMLRFIPMFVSGATCNFVVAMVVGRISGSILLGIGCAATGAACLLFANIVPHATYWAFGFPAATLVVFGADFVFATGSIFVAKVALPEEQSLAGGVFNTVMQVGGAVGLALTGVIADQITQKEAKKLGVDFDPRSPESVQAPMEATLKGYRAAQWLSFAFCMLALSLVVIFLHGIGKVGKSPKAAAVEAEAQKVPDEETGSTRTMTGVQDVKEGPA